MSVLISELELELELESEGSDGGLFPGRGCGSMIGLCVDADACDVPWPVRPLVVMLF